MYRNYDFVDNPIDELVEADRRIGELENELGELRERLADSEERLPQWIPVEERLPEPDIQVLCAMPSGAVEVMRKREASGVWEWWDGDVSYEIAITHWMPLPVPPEVK